MKTIILLILISVMVNAQTYDVGQTNANISLALSQALAQADSNTVYRNAINTKFSIADSNGVNGWYKRAYLDALLAGKQSVMGSNDNYVTDDQLTVITNTSGTNTGDNATNSQYSGLAASKFDVSSAQILIDSVYRSNDTIYFKQVDGTTLYFVDQNTGESGIDSANVSSLISDSLAQYYLAPAAVGSMAYSSDGTTWSVVTADVSPAQLDETYAALSHTHTEFFDTLSYSINIPDTVIAGDNAIWKIPNNITITEIAAFTNSGTVTFNIEERAEVTPNTAGTDVIGSDLVADTDQQETSTFSNASIDRDDWLALAVASITGDPTLFGITIKYIKAN